jgi:hypothetical protein
MKNFFTRRVLGRSLLLGVLLAPLAGCESGAGTGALIGGGTGAAIGGIIGSNSHARAGEGALIGGPVGAVTGAVIGDAADRRAREDYPRDQRPRYEPAPAYTEVRVYRNDYSHCPPPPPPVVVRRYEYRRYDPYAPRYEVRAYRDYRY